MKKVVGFFAIVLLSLSCFANDEVSSLNSECRNHFGVAINYKYKSLIGDLMDFDSTVEFFGGDKGSAGISTFVLAIGYPMLMPFDAVGYFNNRNRAYLLKRLLRVADHGDQSAARDLVNNYLRRGNNSDHPLNTGVGQAAKRLVNLLQGDVTGILCKVEQGLALSSAGFNYIAPFETVNEYMHAMAAQKTLRKARGLFDNPSHFVYKRALYPITPSEIMDILESVVSGR